jgi:hypothetical protein
MYDASRRRPCAERMRLDGDTKSNGDGMRNGIGRKKNGAGEKKSDAGRKKNGAGEKKSGGDINSVTGSGLPQNIIGVHPAEGQSSQSSRRTNTVVQW